MLRTSGTSTFLVVFDQLNPKLTIFFGYSKVLQCPKALKVEGNILAICSCGKLSNHPKNEKLLMICEILNNFCFIKKIIRALFMVLYVVINLMYCSRSAKGKTSITHLGWLDVHALFRTLAQCKSMEKCKD